MITSKRIRTKKENTAKEAKLASEIIELYSSQGDFYNQYNLDISEKSLQDSLKVFCLNTKALIEEQGRPKPYGILYDLSKELTSIISSPCSQLKFIQKTEKYKNLTEKFKEEKLETNYTNITTSRSHDSYFKEPLLKFNDLHLNSSFRPYYYNNEDSSNMLGACYNSSELASMRKI
nr:hypothetical protein [Rickettsia conorii]